jgi:hypothetical protein
MVPHAKCIVLLRDPAERIVSNYYHRVRAGRETKSINEVFSEAMIERLAKGKPQGATENLLYQRSDYVGRLRRWLRHFPEDEMQVLEAEALFREPQKVVSEVCQFLGLEAVDLSSPVPFNVNSGTKEKPARFNELRQAFRQQNRELAEMGYPFTWIRL